MRNTPLFVMFNVFAMQIGVLTLFHLVGFCHVAKPIEVCTSNKAKITPPRIDFSLNSKAKQTVIALGVLLLLLLGIAPLRMLINKHLVTQCCVLGD